MRDEPLPVDPERLLAEDPFVRGLARQLLRDPDRADDLAQETWLSLLRGSGVASSARGFLATVMRRLAVRQRRGRDREARKVDGMPRPDPVPSAATIVAREELRQGVVRAVLALQEPQRDVVLLRFFEHLPPRAIARRLQLPVETVRTRLKRALAQLRLDLDAGTGGDRAAWAVLLVPFARPAPVGFAAGAVIAFQGAMAMMTKSKAAAAVAACAVLFWVGTAVLRGDSDVAPAARDGTGPAVTAAAPAAAPALLPAADRSADTARTAAAAGTAPTTGSLAVHVVWAEDQQPAPGVVVALGDDDEPRPDTRPRVTTDAAGIAAFDDVPEGRVHVRLSRRKAEPEWPRAAIAAGARTELRVAVQQGLRARGIVADGAGRPIAGAEILVTGWGGGEAVPMATSGKDGRFDVRAIETACHIGARAVGFAASPLQQCMSKAGAVVDLRIELVAPSAELTGTVRGPDGDPVAGALVQAGWPEQRNVQRPDGATVMAPRPEVARTDGTGRYALRAQGAGTVPFCVRAKGFAAHNQVVELRAGSRNVCDVQLVAGVTLVGSVRDSNGQPLDVGIAVGEWNALDHRWVRSGRDGTFTVTDLPVGRLSVTVDAEAQGRASKELQGAAGETLRWDVVLDAGLTLRGRVLDADGAPAENVTIEAESARVPGPNWRASTYTDTAGRFELRGCAADQPVTIDLRRYGVFRDLRIRGIRPAADELVLRLPPRPTAHIVGKVLLADRRVPQNVAVSPHLDGEGGSPVESVDAATGAFRIGPYPPGDYQLSVRAPGFPTILLAGHIEGGADWDVGSLQLEPGGTLRVDLVADTAASLPRHWMTVLEGDGIGVAEVDEVGGTGRAGPLRPGDYVLQLGGDGLANAQVPFAVRAGVETHLQMPVHAGVRALLTVAVPEGEDLHARVEVAIADHSGARVYRGVLWCNGRAATTPAMLDPGTYSVAVWCGNRRTVSEWTVPAAGTAELKLRLP